MLLTKNKGSDPPEQYWEGEKVRELDNCLPWLRWTMHGCLYLAWLMDNPKLHTVSLLPPLQAREYHSISLYDHS